MKIIIILGVLVAVILLSGCSSVQKIADNTESGEDNTSLFGEIYHGNEYFILDENGLKMTKDGAAYNKETKLWNAPFAIVREINDTFYCDSLTSPEKFDENMNYIGEMPRESQATKKILKKGDKIGNGLIVTSAISYIKEKLEYNRDTNTTKPGISKTEYTEITLDGEVMLEGVFYVVLDEDMYTANENSVLFYPKPESIKESLGFSPSLISGLSKNYITSNAAKSSAILLGDSVCFYSGNTDNCKWIPNGYKNKPFGSAKLSVNNIRLIWKSDNMDGFYFTVKDAQDVHLIK